MYFTSSVSSAGKFDIPILGVCRGHQLLNVAMGGTLIQHIDNHVGQGHPVHLRKSRVFNYINEKELMVNSLHHQAIGRLGNGLEVIALAHDGTIEAVESPNHTFVVGVQWHPEMYYLNHFVESMNILWKKFILASKERA